MKLRSLLRLPERKIVLISETSEKIATIRLSRQDFTALKESAKFNGISVESFVLRSIEAYVKNKKF